MTIARSLINDPRIILADEPTGNLDSKNGIEIMKTFDNLIKEGKTIVLITHDLEVARHAGRIVSVTGRLLQTVTMKKERPPVSFKPRDHICDKKALLKHPHPSPLPSRAREQKVPSPLEREG